MHRFPVRFFWNEGVAWKRKDRERDCFEETIEGFLCNLTGSFRCWFLQPGNRKMMAFCNRILFPCLTASKVELLILALLVCTEVQSNGKSLSVL